MKTRKVGRWIPIAGTASASGTTWSSRTCHCGGSASRNVKRHGVPWRSLTMRVVSGTVKRTSSVPVEPIAPAEGPLGNTLTL